MGFHKATLIKITGKVQVKAPADKEWRDGRANEELRTGTRIRTGASSSAKIKISDVGEIVIQASSEATVGTLKQVKGPSKAFFFFNKMVTRDDIDLNLSSGDLRASFHKVENRVGNYRINTPIAVAGIRGTKFELDLDGGKTWYEKLEGDKGDGSDQSLTAVVLEGIVELSGGSWTRSLATGQQLIAYSGREPSQPEPADPMRLQGITAEFTDAVPPTFSGAATVSQPDPSSLVVTWPAASDNLSPAAAIVYDLFLATSPQGQDFSRPTATTAPGTLSHSFSSLDATASWYVVVRARDQLGNRDNNTRELTTSTKDGEPPEFSGAGAVARQADGSLAISWSAASDNVSAKEKIVYDVYLATEANGHDWSAPTATTAPAALTHSFAGLAAAQDYFVVVRARDEAGNRDANTREVSTRTDDRTPPQFAGVSEAREVTHGEIEVSWPEAKDDRTEARNIVYDVFVQREPRSQDYAEPVVSSSPGATSVSLTRALEPAPMYYIAVRARDEAGNRDANNTEVAVRSITFLANAVERRTRQLFEAYASRNRSLFMEQIHPAFVGVNARGSVLNATTLAEVLREDFSLMDDAVFDVNVGTVAKGSQDRLIASVIWNGRMRIAKAANETVYSSEKTLMVWDISEAPPKLAAWEGSSPFGLTEPLSGGVVADGGPPRLDDVAGSFDFRIDGDFTDFGGRGFTLTGQNFVEGSRVEHYEIDKGVWRDVTEADASTFITVTYVRPTELRMEFRRFVMQYQPGDREEEDVRLRVVNPDGTASNEFNKPFRLTPGPLRVVDVRIENADELDPMPSPFQARVLDVGVYNLVARDVGALLGSKVFLARTGSSSPERAFRIGGLRYVNRNRSGEGPIRLGFEVFVTEMPDLKAAYEVVLIDERGREARGPLRLGQPPRLELHDVSGDFFFQNRTGPTDMAPRSFTCRGSGFMEGAVVEDYDDERGQWIVTGQNANEPDMLAQTNFISHQEIRLDFTRMIMCWHAMERNGVPMTDPYRREIRLRVRNPDGSTSNEMTRHATIAAGPFELVHVKEAMQGGATGPITLRGGTHYFQVMGNGIVMPVQVRIAEADGSASQDWSNLQPLNNGAVHGSQEGAECGPLLYHFSAELATSALENPRSFQFTVTDGRGQSGTYILEMEQGVR